MCNEHGFLSAINEITRPSSKTCLDHYMLRCQKTFQVHPLILKFELTDHHLTHITLNTQHNKKTQYTETKKVTFNKVNHINLINDVQAESWQNVYDSNTNVSLAFQNFTDKLSKLILKNSELKEIKSKQNRLKPWMTDGLLRSVRQKQKLYIKHQKNPENLLLKKEYLDYKDKLKKTIWNTRVSYYEKEINETNDIKLHWKLLKEISGTKPKTEINIKRLKSNNKILQSKTDISECFNDFFTRVGPEIANKCKNFKINNTYKNKLHNKKIGASMQWLPASTQEVSDIIKKLNPNKSAGSDNIKPKIIKLLNTQITPILVHLFNLSLSESIFPNSLIIPIYKAKEKDLPSNYRPVALLSLISKVFEKIVHNRLFDFLSKFNYFSENQYDFLPNKGTDLEQNLIIIFQKILIKALKFLPCLLTSKKLSIPFLMKKF